MFLSPFLGVQLDSRVDNLVENVTEQIAVVETERLITRDILMNYIHYVPDEKMPVLFQPEATTNAISDRELLLKALSMGQMINEMRTEINNLKQIITSMARQGVQINGGIADEPAISTGRSIISLTLSRTRTALPMLSTLLSPQQRMWNSRIRRWLRTTVWLCSNARRLP